MLLGFMAVTFLSTAQSKKYWTIKVDPAQSAELKQLFDGKKVKEGKNRFSFSKLSFVDVVVQKAKVVNMIFVSSAGGTTITTDYAKAIATTGQAMDHCSAQRYLCQIQCKLGGGTDPTRNGSCLEQCEKEFKVCPFLPGGGFGGFGGLVLL